MFTLLKILHLDAAVSEAAEDRLLALLAAAAEALPGVASAAAGKTLPRALNGGRIMWRLSFATEPDYWDCLAAPRWEKEIFPALAAERGMFIDDIAYRTIVSDSSSGRSREGLWRCLVLSVDAHTVTAKVREFEKDLLLMPDHVKSIKNWSLGRTVSAAGRRAWTHVWEQEFDDIAGLEGEYMTHPIHWGLVDGWFDPECPQCIVDPFLIHAAFAIDQAVIV